MDKLIDLYKVTLNREPVLKEGNTIHDIFKIGLEYEKDKGWMYWAMMNGETYMINENDDSCQILIDKGEDLTLSKTRMDTLDKEQVDEFMRLVHRTVYSVIANHEKFTEKPFEVRDDDDMDMLTLLAHSAVNVTINTLKKMDQEARERSKKNLKVIKNEDNKNI